MAYSLAMTTHGGYVFGRYTASVEQSCYRYGIVPCQFISKHGCTVQFIASSLAQVQEPGAQADAIGKIESAKN
jgi:hypothetical protein